MTISRKYVVSAVIAILYAVTAFFVWLDQESIMSSRATSAFAEASRLQAMQEKICAENQNESICGRPFTTSNKPYWKVLVVPVFPALAVVKSEYAAGPMWAGESIRLVLWYGTGSYNVHTFRNLAS